MAALVLIVVYIFPLILSPGVEPLADLQFGTPSSLPVEIANQNLTPLNDVEYSCEIIKLILAQGADLSKPPILIRGTIRKLPGRRAVTARCQAAQIVTDPLKAAEYKLTLTYRAYPWPQRRTKVYQIDAQIDAAGKVTGWKLN